MRLPTKISSLQYLKENGLNVETILDVGIQYQTKELKEIWPDVRHLLFEPIEEYYPFIEANYKSIDHVLVRGALSNRDGDDFLSVQRKDSSTITHSSLEGPSANIPSERRSIQVFTLDTFLRTQSCSSPYLLKLDVDGHELSILEGAEKTLEDCSCVIIEAPIGHLPERMNYLITRGFYLWDIVDPCYYYNNLHQVDLIFLGASEIQKAPFSPWQNFEFKWEEWKEFSRNA